MKALTIEITIAAMKADAPADASPARVLRGKWVDRFPTVPTMQFEEAMTAGGAVTRSRRPSHPCRLARRRAARRGRL